MLAGQERDEPGYDVTGNPSSPAMGCSALTTFAMC
jgi:hypothetical protein